MPNGAGGDHGASRPWWRNRKIIAAVAAGAAAVAAVVIALATTGNGAQKPGHATTSATPSTPAAPQRTPNAASTAIASAPQARPPIAPSTSATAGRSHTALVTQRQFGQEWPLTVSSGWVRCVPHSTAYTFRPTGSARVYALNLPALKLGYPSIAAIQIQSQDGTGEPADVSPLQERAADVC